MKRLTLALVGCAAWMAGASVASAQMQPPVGYSTVIPATRMAPSHSAAEQFSAVISPAPLPTFSYTLQAPIALGGGIFTGSIVGRSPLNRGKTKTTIPTQVIPLVITITDTTTSPPTTVTYDPTVPNSCAPGTPSPTDLSIITGSPIFTNNAWTMNGVSIGTTQYIDAFQRAQFWSQVQGTPYHLILSQSTLPSEALTFAGTGIAGSSGPGSNYPTNIFVGGCATGHIGVVNINDLDAAVQALITGPLAGTVNVGTFPIFLTSAVVAADPGFSIFANCCILGYHSGLFVGGNLQIYSPFSLNENGLFGNLDVSTLAHEMGEAINDPATNNPTPLWGNIGQVVGACQNNFEVGDPLSPGFGTPTKEFTVPGVVIPTYHLQELAFYSWFYGSTALGVGAGGGFSNNGTFKGDAIICPPGGTN